MLPLTVLHRWRIGIDEEVVAALTEPRYPSPENDDSPEAIVLTQTIFLCQLFLHLQEFDPCSLADNEVPEEDFVRPFQDSLQREFNSIHASPARDGPAPDGEVLERVVRGLMLAQREDPPPQHQQQQQQKPPTSPQSASPPDHVQTQLHQVLLAILKELNGPLHGRLLRYAAAHGRRDNETWAARFATRIMQWRAELKTNPAWLTREVIRVNRHDVCPLDEEGLEVYRLIRNAAPGLVHLATPVQPEMMPRLSSETYAQRQQQHHQQQQQRQYQQEEHQQHHHHQHHQRTLSSGMRVQHMLASPMAQTPKSTNSEYSDTPRTTPQFTQHQHHQQHHFAPPGGEGARIHVKRRSQDISLPPSSKRHRSSQHGGRYDGAADVKDDIADSIEPVSAKGAAVASADSSEPHEKHTRVKTSDSSQDAAIPLRGGYQPGATDIDNVDESRQQHQQQLHQHQYLHRHESARAAEETNALLRRVLSGMSELSGKLDAARSDMGQRLAELDNRLRLIQDWIGVGDEEGQ